MEFKILPKIRVISFLIPFLFWICQFFFMSLSSLLSLRCINSHWFKYIWGEAAADGMGQKLTRSWQCRIHKFQRDLGERRWSKSDYEWQAKHGSVSSWSHWILQIWYPQDDTLLLFPHHRKTFAFTAQETREIFYYYYSCDSW